MPTAIQAYRQRRGALQVATALPRLHWWHEVAAGVSAVAGAAWGGYVNSWSPLAMTLCALVAGCGVAFVLNEYRIFVALMVPHRIKISLTPNARPVKEIHKWGGPLFWVTARLQVHNETTEPVSNVKVRVLSCFNLTDDGPSSAVVPAQLRLGDSLPDGSGAYPAETTLGPEGHCVFDLARRPSAGPALYYEVCFAVPQEFLTLSIATMTKSVGKVGPQFKPYEYRFHVEASGSNTLPDEKWLQLKCDDHGVEVILEEWVPTTSVEAVVA